jgi:hypothetical protein
VAGFKRFAKVLDVIGTTDEKGRPAIQIQELIQPVVLSNRVTGSDLPFYPMVVPIVKESTDSNILLLPNIECLSLVVGRIAMSMDDAFAVCDLLTKRLRGVLLREDFATHFLGNRSNSESLADLFNEIAKFGFCWSSRQLIFVACADKHDGLHFGPEPCVCLRGAFSCAAAA